MTSKKLPGLQIARAIAALSIVYFHSWTVLDRFPKGTAHPIPLLAEHGWLGVDLFFAISGYVICLVISKQPFGVRSFLVRRVFRVYPLWLLTLTLFAVLAWGWRGLLPRETFGFFAWSASLLPIENFPFYDIGWSLQHEMLFYLLSAAIAPIFGLWGLAAFLGLSTAAFHLISMPWFPGHFAMYHAEFLAGVLAFMLSPRWRLRPWLALSIGAASLWFFIEDWGGRYYAPIALFFLIVGFAQIRLPAGRWLKAAVALGDASYSIYLIHPLVFMIVRGATMKVAGPGTTWLEEPIRFGCFVLIIALALLSWRYFERPTIKLGNWIAKLRLDNSNDVVAHDSGLHVPVSATTAGILNADARTN